MKDFANHVLAGIDGCVQNACEIVQEVQSKGEWYLWVACVIVLAGTYLVLWMFDFDD